MSQVLALIEKFNNEISGEKFSAIVDNLQLYIDNREGEEIIGLKEKLEHVDRGGEYLDALDKKDHFAKLLEKLKYYQSTQELMAYFMASIEEVFSSHIMHQGEHLPRSEVQTIVEEKVVQPILAELGTGLDSITVSARHIRGMIYWLADRCWIRWH